ncbi:MAG: hypothetical protein E7434_04740 [Ruminococcaceae bacterium]|nr:hypothetical protein [Oscillospiraceae bacterium]
MLQKKSKSVGLLFFGIFLFLVFVMWCTPYSSDDFEFASIKFNGLKAFLGYVLYYGNGRVLGNVTSIAFVQMPLLAIFGKAFVITSIIYLLPRVLGLSKLHHYLLSFVLVLGVNPALFGEVYTWNCGFGNYMLPIFLTLVIVFLLQKYPSIRNRFAKLIVFAIVFGFGIASQLFVEHTTVLNFLLAAFFTFKGFRHKEKSKFLALTWLLAVTLGAGLMVLVPKLFFKPNNRTGSYRSVYLGSIGELISSGFDNAIVLLNNFTGTLGILLCVGTMLTLWQTRSLRSKKCSRILFSAAAFSLLYVLLGSFLRADTILVDNSFHGLIVPASYEYGYRIITALVMLMTLGVWIFAARQLQDKRVLFFLVLTVVSLLMLLIVSPIPTRVTYQAYVLIVLAVLICLTKLPEPCKRFRTCGRKALCLVCCVLTLTLGIIFFNCRQMALAREEHILQQLEQGAETIEIFKLPYRHVFWDSQWSMAQYYADGDVTFEMVDYTYWQVKYVIAKQ